MKKTRFRLAAETLELAKAIMPYNSSLFHDSGDINLNLYHSKHDYKYLDVATRSFQRAIALSPNKVGPHIGLSLCLSSANRVEDARAELVSPNVFILTAATFRQSHGFLKRESRESPI
jgi:hypothetical protein